MFTLVFWKEATERAVKTFAQFILTLGAAQVFNVFALDWLTILGIGLGGMVLSYATSIVSSNIGPEKGNPSLVKETNV